MIRSLARRFSSRFRKKSFALNQLDLKLNGHLRFKNGFFVEAGANDGVNQSNTLFFEKYLRWRGLLIEAIPDLASRCRENRPACLVENCALVAPDYDRPIVEMQYCNLMSFARGTFGGDLEDEQYKASGMRFLEEGDAPYAVEVPARTLSSVLDAHHIGHVDLLSLDVEGQEYEVLQGLDLQRHAPTYLLIEVWHDKKKRIESLLSSHYRTEAVLNSNEIYSDILYTTCAE